MRAERSQLPLKLVPHFTESVVCVAESRNRWHSLHFSFALRFTSLMWNEWSGWTRWGALNSSLWGHLLWAGTQHKFCLGWAQESCQVTTVQLHRSVSVLKSWSHLSTELPVRFWWEPDVCVVDKGLMNLTTTLQSDIKKEKRVRMGVCVYIDVYVCVYRRVYVLLFPLTREVPRECWGRGSHQQV